MPEQIKKVVIIKMLGLGSIVLMTPMIRALKEKFSDIEIHLITLEGNEVIPKLYDMTSHIYPLRRNSLFNFLLDTLKIILMMRKHRPYIVIDAEFFSRYTTVLSFLLRGQYNIGFYNRDYYRGNLIDFHTYFNPYRHMTRNFFELVSPLSCSDYSPLLESPKISDKIIAEVKTILEAHKISLDKPIILLNPNVSDTSPEIDRSWPLNNFVKLARYCQQLGFQVVFIGGPDQKERTERAAFLCGDGAFSTAGKMDIEHLLALMEKSFLLITNDSGPLHLAVSADLPTFSFFGTESPIIYGYDHGLNKAFHLELACSPCLSVFNYKRGKCEFDSKCLKEIHPDQVIAYFDETLPDLYEHYRNK